MESYSRRTSITPSSSKVRWCGVVAELHWLGNLAFLRRPPASTDSKTSLLSMVDSGIFSHQQCRRTNVFSTTNRRQTSTWWVGRNKNFFSSFSTRSQKYELFAFWQQQQSSETPRDWSRLEQWNGVEWHTLHMRARWLDQVTTKRTWLQAMNGVSREKNTEKIGANKAAQHHGTTTMAESPRILRKRKFSFFGVTKPALKSCYRVRFEKIFTSVRSFGERPNQTNHIQLGIYVRFKLPAYPTGHENRVIARGPL